MIRSIVTSNLIDKISNDYNIDIYEVLTGCKNIANKKEQLKDKNYIFGYEESLGYMFNIDINDKNGFSSLLCMTEILCYCKDNNISIKDYIDSIYKKYGYVYKSTLNFTFDDINYKEKINNIMEMFRNKKNVIKNDDYKIIDYISEVGELKTNAIKYIFKDDSYILIRPSGTEPKIKIYIVVCEKSDLLAQNKINEFQKNINLVIKNI